MQYLWVGIYPQFSCTLFSIPTAGLFLYVVLTVGLLWLSHTLMFFWGVVWPLHYRIYTNSGKMKYVHLTIVAVSLLLPIISILACRLSEGYGLSVLAYYKCASRGVNDTFCAVIVPLGIILITGTSLLVYIIWTLACVVTLDELLCLLASVNI